MSRLAELVEEGGGVVVVFGVGRVLPVPGRGNGVWVVGAADVALSLREIIRCNRSCTVYFPGQVAHGTQAYSREIFATHISPVPLTLPEPAL